MRKEPIYYYDLEKDKFLVEGFEVLADFPYLLSNPEIDYKTFIHHLDLLKNEDKKYVYHINIGTKTLEKYIDKIIEAIKKHPLKDNLVIEILEESHSKVDSFIEKLHQNAIKMSIDDFGTESANLDRVIKNIDFIESIKIDRVVWKNFTEIVKSLVESNLIKKANIKILAEKVETEEEVRKLISSGVRYFQGWYFKDFKTIVSKENLEDINLILQDSELLSYLFNKTLKISSYDSIEDLLNTFKAVIIAHFYNIPIENKEEFEQILDMVHKKESLNICHNLDEVAQKTLKNLNFILASLQTLENLLNKLKNERNKIETLNEIMIIRDSLKKYNLDLKYLLENFKTIPHEDFISKKEFMSTLKYRFNKKLPTTIVYLYFPSLRNVFFNKGVYYYKLTLDYLINKLNYYLPKDTVGALVDNFTIGIILDGNIKKNQKLIDSLKKHLSNTTFQIEKKFIELEPKIAYTDFKESDEDSEKPIYRIEALHYELTNFNQDVASE
jgi:EAL domain-containing protein (putative c-di-GMP-specific phosphodiesterase class I)/DNA-binding protein H-NS